MCISCGFHADLMRMAAATIWTGAAEVLTYPVNVG